MRLNRLKPILLLTVFVLCLVAGQTPAAAQSWSNGYAHRRTISIDHTKVPNTDQTNFPVLFSGAYSYLATSANGGQVTNANGYDIIFTSDAAGASPLAYERESYNASTGAVTYWVRVPTVSHTADTLMYMFYANSSVTADQSNTTAVWDSNYKGVWHLGTGNNLTVADSTSNAFTLINNNSVSATAGEIGEAASFNGSSSYLSNSSLSINAGSSITISYWNYVASNNVQNASTFTIGASDNPNRIQAHDPWSDSNLYWDYGSWSGGGRVNTNYSSYLGSWTYTAFEYDSSSNTHSVYLNGSLAASSVNSNVPTATQTGIDIGAWPTGLYEHGNIDDFRVSTIARSADWTATEYNNQSNPSTFSSVGADDCTCPNIAGLSATSGLIGSSVTITGTNFGSVQGSSTVAFNGTTATATIWSATSISVTVPTGASPGYVVVTESGIPSNGIDFKVTSGYSYFRAITIDHTKVPNTDQTNFPVLISGTYSYLATTANGGNVSSATGYDIIFSPDAAGSSILDFEQESYSSSTGAINYWVRVPAVSHSTDTVIYMFYGNSSVSTDQFNKAGVWDSSYALVSHLSDSAPNTTVADSTSNANTLTNQANTSNKTAAGKINNGLTYNGSSDYSGVANNSSLNIQSSAITLEVWAKPTNSTAASSERLIVKEVSGNTYPYVRYGLFRATSGSSQLTFWISTGGFTNVSGGSTSAGTWTHAVGVYDGSTMTLYVNGSSVGTASQSGNIGASSTPLVLGADTEASMEYFNGILDEARISNIARSADWVATEYANQNNPSTFYNVGSSGSGNPGSPRIVSLSPTAGPAETSVTITGTNFGSTQGSSTVAFNGTTATPTSWSNSQVVALVPSGAGSGNVVVTVSGVASNGLNFAVAPGITSLSPPSGAISSSVTITGTAFGATQGSSTVTFNGVSASPTSWSATSIVLPVPVGAATGNVVVTVGGLASSGVDFGVAPGITSLSPTSGVVGTSVTITGTTFGATQGLSTVTFNGASSSPTSWSATSIVVPVPVGAATGNVVVTVGSLASSGVSFSVTLGIASLSPTSGKPGTPVTITGVGFGATQGSGTVTFNGAQATPTSWSDTSIVVPVPSGAMTGNVVATVAGIASNGLLFTPLTTGWLDQDVGPVGVAGTAGYANDTFTVKGAGGLHTSSEEFHFVYQPLSGDGTIVTRVVSSQGNQFPTVGLMIRETLAPNAVFASTYFSPNQFFLSGRSSTGGNTGYQTGGGSASQPYWLKLVRSGSTFTGYESGDGASWTQIASATISMAQNAYIGLFVNSGTSNSLQTATFDNVSLDSAASPAPVITGASATTGSIGSQVVISGTYFGASQGSSQVTVNGAPMTINSWSNTSITVTIASGAASGLMVVVLAPSMNDSNAVYFTVTTQPLPSGWFDQDTGSVGLAGSAGYANGTFTVKGAGVNTLTADAFHFAYQPLSGDGTIVARMVSAQSTLSAGVMIRETLAPGSAQADVMRSDDGAGYFYYSFVYRASAGGNVSGQQGPYGNLPYWMRLARSGNTFTGYTSPDGVYWTQAGTAQISMASNVDVGLAVDSGNTSTLGTATFDNVSITSGTPYPTPNITAITPTYGGIGTSVTVTGSTFVATQGSSSVRFNGASATSITSWSDTQIVAAVPSAASTGPLTVVVNGIGSNQNFVFTLYNPVISSLDPPAGPVGGTITLNGSGFGTGQGSSMVKFNGVSASATSWSDTSVNATVPSGATSGPVTVTEGGVTSSGVQFNVIEATAITGISPASAPIGGSVVITGTGFGPTQSNSAMHFYGETAITITSWSDASITAVVPAGALTGPVFVTVAGHTATGPLFTLIASTTVTDSLGNSSNYDALVVGGQWMSADSQGSGCTTCTIRGVTQNTYDSLGNKLSTTDPAGHTTTYTYDSLNNMLSQSVLLDSNTTATTSYTYNIFGEVLTVTDPLGHVMTNVYDTHGNLTSVTSPAPNSSTAASVTHMAYDSKGELTSITDPLNHVTTMTYTAAGLIATITDAQNNVTSYGYDAQGNRTSVTDALNHQTTFTYDAMARLTKITYPDSTTSTFAYDSRARRTSVTDQNSKTTTYAYDDADRLTSVTDAAQHTTYYAYDTENNLTSITDASSNQTAFTYDAFGRVTRSNFPSSLSENYQYDADNNLTSKTDRKGQTITYLYDALNRLTKKQYTDSTEVDFVYDLVGKIQQVNDPTGTYAFAYDNMGRLLGTTTSYSFLTSRSFTNAYTYDAASNRTGFTDPESGSTTFSYDTLNRLTTLAPPSAFSTGSFGFSYDALSRRTQMTRPNSVVTNYTYDNLSRLLTVLHQLSGSTIDGASYTLDSAGNRTAKTDQRVAVASNYTYDSIYQVLSAAQGSTTTESYTYDPVGNRTASLGVSSYTTNASNELTAIPGVSYTYDSNGNTLSKVVGSDTTTYVWDYENRLTSVTLPGTGGTVTFKYDPLGRRIYKSSSSSTSVFAYDGDNLIEETNSSGAAVARYEQTQNIDEPLAMLRSSTTSYYNADGLGSITSLANGAGALAQTYGYDSFGKQTSSSGSLTNPFQYTSRESDAETGLYYYRARYYDPSLGRFLTEDPLRYDPTSFYSYVGGNPIVWADPSGLYKCATGASCDFQPDFNKALIDFEKCAGHEITVTCGDNGHPPADTHTYGWAADIGHNNNPWLDRKTAEDCFTKSFPQGIMGSYAQQEYNSKNERDGWHYHFQYFPAPGDLSGFRTGIAPHGPRSKP
jgi:RHS repeat-associated protein